MTTGFAGRDVLVELLRRPRYEVFPLAGIEDQVAEHVPGDAKVTVTCSPQKGIETSLELSEELARRGFEVVPHIPARLVSDQEHLKDILGRLRDAGVREILAIGGDVEEPAGKFSGAFELLVAMGELRHGFDEVGIAGYPESHPLISDEATIQAMFDKAPLATYIVSQVCLEPSVIARWISEVRERGVDLPIYIGIPGAVSRPRLMRIATKIGVGESARFLRKHGNMVARLLLRGSYNPGDLIDGLTPRLIDPRSNVGGFHIYTFNELGRTERWRRQAIQRLGRELP